MITGCVLQPTPECPVVVVTDSVHQVSIGPWCTGYGSVPAVPDPTVYISGIEHLKIQIHLEKILRIYNTRIMAKIFFVYSLHCVRSTRDYSSDNRSVLLHWQLRCCSLSMHRQISMKLASFFRASV